MSLPNPSDPKIPFGSDRCRCFACGEYFNSTYAFTKHRAGRLFREQMKRAGHDWALTIYTLCAPQAEVDAPDNEKLLVPERHTRH
jgi:hypothetical protein